MQGSVHDLRNSVKLVKLTELDIENLPNHKVKSSKEWSSACPSCGGEDRFLFWPNEGNFWCRKEEECGLNGFINSEVQSRLTADQLTDIEHRKREVAQVESDRKHTALQRLQKQRNDLVYHRNLNGKTDYVRRKWGLRDETVEHFMVGYCHACPTAQYSDSITAPYYWGDDLINLQHRLTNPNGGGKYRPEASGLPLAIFNANIIKDEEWLILVEGAFTTMVLWQNTLPVIGIPGATNFKQKWLELFSPEQTVYVALDPGVESAALKISQMISNDGINARLVTLPTDPDEFFTLYNGTITQFYSYLENGRVI